jgi:hypothetical protein
MPSTNPFRPEFKGENMASEEIKTRMLNVFMAALQQIGAIPA